ncbi:hypothetical protein FKM82_023894 [Ascaphus truei]
MGVVISKLIQYTHTLYLTRSQHTHKVCGLCTHVCTGARAAAHTKERPLTGQDLQSAFSCGTYSIHLTYIVMILSQTPLPHAKNCPSQSGGCVFHIGDITCNICIHTNFCRCGC